jgi:class 3 adenylate cyclase/tetratricopeptide (TPR) repeat protein
MHRLVPDLILRNYAAGHTGGAFEAVCMFVDISGFSAMTDTLMQHGQHGAEVLAQVMRAAFAPLIRAVYEHRGFVVAQAGDSFTALFPLTEDHEQPGRRALAAAWSIREHAGAHAVHTTPYGEFVVSIKIGAAFGEVRWGILTSADAQRAAYFFGGPAVDSAADAEHQARPGEVILTAGMVELVRDAVQVEPAGPYYRLLAIADRLPPSVPLMLSSVDAALAARFFPASLLEQALSGEFRQTTYLFVSLPTVRTEVQLARFMQTVFALQDQYGGLLKLQFGDKGAHLLLTWGAPLAHENDIARALNFVLDLQTQTAIPINGGITHRIAHAGFIGSELAEEYAAYGRGVNLAARFMTAAPRGEIWLDASVAQHAQAVFEVEYLGEQLFKGFAQPQQVYRLIERKEQAELTFAGPLVGRALELSALTVFVQPIFAGQFAGIVVVWGEPGVGKSRLLAAFVRQLSDSAPSAVQICLGQTDEIVRQSLNPFRYWLKRHFGVSETQGEARNKRSFNRTLDDLIAATADPHLADELDRTRSLLGALLNLEWSDSLYAQLDAQGRYETTIVALTSLLQAESRRRPLVFVLEDAHWLDEDSLALLPRLVRAITSDEQTAYPIGFILTARPEVPTLPLGSVTYHELALSGLSREALAALAAAQLGGPADEALLNLLAERADGNPFFAEQILSYLQEEGALSEDSSGWTLAQERGAFLPDDVHAVLVARLDRLTAEVREVVQTAAVLGREFEVRVLAAMLQNDARLLEKVARASEAAIWAAISEIRYLFRHALLRDAAYAMQVQTRRQALHAVALQALEQLYVADLEDHAGELAYHAAQAGLAQQTFDYALRAGDVAFRSYANAEAVAHYRRALELHHLASTEQLIHLYRNGGRALELTGRHTEALARYEELAELAHERDDSAMQLASLLARALIVTLDTPVQNRKQGLTLAEQALALAQTLGDRPSEAQALWVLMLACGFGQGDHSQAVDYGERALALARELKMHEQVAFILNDLGMFYPFHQAQWEASVAALEEAASLWGELGNLLMQAATLGMIGINALLTGEYGRAATVLEESMRLRRSIQNVWGVAEVGTVWAQVCWEQGDFGQAIALASEGMRAGDQSGAYAGKVFCRLELGLFYSQLGAIDTGQTYGLEALRLGREHDQLFVPMSLAALAWIDSMQGNLPESEATIAEARQALERRISFPTEPHFVVLVGGLIALAQGDWAGANAAADEVAAKLVAMRVRLYLPDAGYLKGRALLAQGRREEARAALKQARAVAEEIGCRRMLWLILFALSQAAADSEERQRLLAEAQATIGYIAEHIGDSQLRATFLDTPPIRAVLQALGGG